MNSKFKQLDLAKILSTLEELEFPLAFSEGLESISFTQIKGEEVYGLYENCQIQVDIRGRRRFKTIIETVVHEIAHHVDNLGGFSQFVSEERRLKGHFIHKRARGNDEEYFARGFERFYSIDPQDKKDLRKNCPKLYRLILRVHKEFAVKRP